MSVVTATDLHRHYGEVAALDGVSLDVEEGEVVSLIGPNGAGKTTLVRCLTGTTAPDSGTARLLGTIPSKAPAEEIGLLPQAFDPPARLTARELVGYHAGLYDDARDPAAVLDEVGIDADRDTWYTNLSGGQRRRVCVATALVNDPDVLFLDEPTTGIDPAGRRAVWTLVESLRDRGTTVLLTTHDMDEAAYLADRVILMSSGQVVASGSPTDLIAEYGGPSRLHVETDDTLPEHLDGFAVRAVSNGLLVEDVRPTDIGAVVRALDDANVSFQALHWEEPDLEDVYLATAGESASRPEGHT
jgi:ABC-2 type transport system ATP-binding protein